MLNIQWSPPYTIKEGYATKWRREWAIPSDMVNGFFAFWKNNRFKMLADGFTVTKSNHSGKWFLYETKDDVALFKSFEEKPLKPEEKVVLAPYKLKNKSGLRSWQVDAAEKLMAAINHWGAAIDGSDTGTGKCLIKGTPVKLYDGSTKKVEDILVGDCLMGDDSTHREVLSLARGQDILYKIKPLQYGEEWGCNSEHILVLYNTRTKELGEFSVKEYLKKSEKSSRFKHEWKLIRTSVEYPSYHVDISPYLMGLWIGDGTWNSLSITASRYESEIIKYLYSYSEKNNLRISESKPRSESDAITFYIRGLQHGKNEQWDLFKKYGFSKSREKFIPKSYLLNDRLTRLSLLAGIIDSDGSKCNNGCYEITTKWNKLKENIVELCRSLGYGVSYVQREILEEDNNFKFGGKYWRIHISGAHDIPCKIERKKSTPRKQIKSVLISGFTVEKIGYGDYYGFEISGNRRFLLGDFTITHNTYTACAVARELGYKIVVVCPKAVIKSWHKVLYKHFKMGDQVIDIVNYEKLRNGRKDSKVASYVLSRKTKREVFTWKIPKKSIIIFDESQKLKNWKTQNAKTCVSALKEGFTILFCSATNATNPLEMRAVGLALQLFKPSAAHYYEWAKAHGVYQGNWGLEFNNDPEVLKRLHKLIFEYRGVRLRRDSIPNFPDCEIIPEVYNMDEEDTKRINQIYDDMEKELKRLEKIKKGDGESELVIRLRARQEIELIKVPLFVDMIEEAKEQGFSVVVFVNFTDTLIALSQRLGTTCVFDGKTPDKVRDKNVELFQNDTERVILVNVQSGGAGLSLHDLNGKFPRMSIISPTYSPVYMRQALGRVWRDDAKTKCIQRIVCVANTVEEDVCRNVQQKLDNLDMLNDGDLQYGKNYEIISD